MKKNCAQVTRWQSKSEKGGVARSEIKEESSELRFQSSEFDVSV
jgi:hypothetical protein